jgi:hypothetical protein
LLILPPFLAVRFSRADDPYGVVRLGVDDDKEAIPLRDPQKNAALLVVGMIGIRDRTRQRVHESAYRLVKGYSMLLEIGPGLGWIPPEGDRHPEIL